MKDISYYNQQLFDGIPFRFRAYFEEIVSSYAQSQLMLEFIGKAISLANDDPTYLPDAAFAIGSFGRQDGSAKISDFDVIYLYDGEFDETRRDKIRESIKEIIKKNKILQFDHREKIENGNFDFGNSNAYPVLSSTELMRDENFVRQVQILTESRSVFNLEKSYEIKKGILLHFGYSDNHLESDFTEFLKKLDLFKDEYCKFYNVVTNEEERKITNIKIIKLFALREFFYIATLFSVADISIGLIANDDMLDESLRKISAPSAQKIFSYSHRRNSYLLPLIDKCLEAQKNDIRDILEKIVKKLSLQQRTMLETGEEGNQEETNIRALTLGVLINFNSLLQKLHDVKFVDKVNSQPINFAAWTGSAIFIDIQKHRTELIENSKRLAQSIIETLEYIEKAIHAHNFHNTKTILNKVINYNLELK